MKWGKSDTRYSLRWFLLALGLLVVISLPLGAQQMIRISPKQYNELKELSDELRSHIAPLRTHIVDLENSLNEREKMLSEQSNELFALRLLTSSLQIKLDQIAKQLAESEQARMELSQSITELTDSSIQLQEIARNETRRKRIWQIATVIVSGVAVWQMVDQ